MVFRTNHKVYFRNSDNMEGIADGSVNLVVTSPPYPMISMWDEMFSSFNPSIKEALENNDGIKAYELMNEELNKVWKEVGRVLAPGGIACINIGDATRKIGERFQLYPNHSRVISFFEKMGFEILPAVIWRKETNKPNKYMGSGMLPPNAYVTLEHEYILIFRKGNREFKDKDKLNRHKSSYFWEERNQWFSDLWANLKGIPQSLKRDELRERSAAYPLELAFRLINMYSVQGDLVLDPFFGTGTTMMAAICTGRNSVGFEIEENFKKVINIRIDGIAGISRKINNDRLERHKEFVAFREEEKSQMKHKSYNYGFNVMTGQEKGILLPVVAGVEKADDNEFIVHYEE